MFQELLGRLARHPSLDEAYLDKWLAAFHDVVNRDLIAEYRNLKVSRDSVRTRTK
jgi:hypothetical protein